jgi:hypothetical protein
MRLPADYHTPLPAASHNGSLLVNLIWPFNLALGFSLTRGE